MEEKLKQIRKDIVRIVLFGPESCGKSTLGAMLADRYNTFLVEENLRGYFEQLKKEKRECKKSDIIKIAEGQMNMENKLASKANDIIICDTDLLQISVYSRHYYNGYCPKALEEYALKNKYDLYLLMYMDIPWVDDGIRDMPEGREYMFRIFEDILISNKKNYVTIKGSKQDRFSLAEYSINKILENR